MRFTTADPSTHNITIPNHDPIRVGTFSQIIREVAVHLDMTTDDLLAILLK